MRKCVFCKGKLEHKTGEYKVRWVDTVVTVADASYLQCTGCGRTTFEADEAFRLETLAEQAHREKQGLCQGNEDLEGEGEGE